MLALRTPSAAAPVVAVAGDHAPERALAQAEVCAPAMVLEAGEHPGPSRRRGLRRQLDRDVADQARGVLAGRAHVEQADTRDLFARACRSARAAGSRRRRRARPLRAPPLLAGRRAWSRSGPRRTGAGRGPGRRRCRTGRGRRRRAPRRGRSRSARSRSRARAAPLEHEQVAAVGVDVHQVRVQRADAQRATAELRHRAPPRRCRCARPWLRSRALRPRAGRPRARRARASRG